MRAYVADTQERGDSGIVHIIDLPSGKKVGELRTGYLPSVAATPARQRIFVAHTLRQGRDLTKHEIVVYNAKTLKEVTRKDLGERFMYNIAPTAPEIVPSRSGASALVLNCRVIRDDVAEFSIRSMSVGGRSAGASEVFLPFAPNAFGALTSSAREVFFDASGHDGEALGVVKPSKPTASRRSAGAQAAKAGKSSSGIVMMFASGRPRAISAQAARDDGAAHSKDEVFPSIGVAASPDGKRTYHITRDALVRVFDPARGMLAEPVKLTLEPGDIVPLQQIIATRTHLYVGTAGSESAARGQVEVVYEFELTPSGFFRKRAFRLPVPAEKIVLDPKSKSFVTLSIEKRSLRVFAIDSFKTIAETDKVGKSPVEVAVSA